MTKQSELKRSHLFTLRLWAEVVDEQHIKVRGVALHVRSGIRVSIHNWLSLQAFLIQQLKESAPQRLEPWSEDESADWHE